MCQENSTRKQIPFLNKEWKSSFKNCRQSGLSVHELIVSINFYLFWHRCTLFNISEMFCYISEKWWQWAEHIFWSSNFTTCYKKMLLIISWQGITDSTKGILRPIRQLSAMPIQDKMIQCHLTALIEVQAMEPLNQDYIITKHH